MLHALMKKFFWFSLGWQDFLADSLKKRFENYIKQ
jgi:hypothetical protein